MACIDCLNNCDPIISDQCVQYTGPAIPVFNICQGESLSQFEAHIIAQLQGIVDGTNVLPADVTVTTCAFLSDMFGATSPTLSNLLQLLVDGECALKAMIDTINTTIGNTTVFNTGCLTGLPTNPTKDEVLQAAVDLLCSLNATVALFPSTYVTNASLLTQVTNIVNSVIAGGSSQFNTRMVPFIAYEYYGSMSNFDSNGVGRASLNFDKIYICNGANGTPDKRGRVAVGAVRNVPGGGSLDPAVDPTNPLNPNWAVNDKAGENTHTLLTAEIPSHTHTINDPGHSHSYTGTVADGRGSDAAKTASPTTLQTSGAVTNITINATGGSQPHNNIQPTIAANYIMYIP